MHGKGYQEANLLQEIGKITHCPLILQGRSYTTRNADFKPVQGNTEISACVWIIATE